MWEADWVSRWSKALRTTVHVTFILDWTAGADPRDHPRAHRVRPKIDTVQVSLAAPCPGTALYEEAQCNGWLGLSVGYAGRAPEV